jgi:Spy/CpxP family protein refolding chaperone
MKTKYVSRITVVIAALFFSILVPALAQIGQELQLAELSKKLQLTEQQKKDLTPAIEQRDKEIKALKADTSMGKLQKLRKAQEIQGNFRNQAAKVLNPQQLQKLDALQAERRAKLRSELGH